METGCNCLTPALERQLLREVTLHLSDQEQEDWVYLGTGYTVVLTYAIQKTLTERERCQEG